MDYELKKETMEEDVSAFGTSALGESKQGQTAVERQAQRRKWRIERKVLLDAWKRCLGPRNMVHAHSEFFDAKMVIQAQASPSSEISRRAERIGLSLIILKSKLPIRDVSGPHVPMKVPTDLERLA